MKASKTLFAVLVIIAGIALDQYTKGLAVEAVLQRTLPIEVTSFFNIAFAWNTGISFSLLNSHGPMMKLALTGFAFLLSFILLVWLIREAFIIPKVAFGCIIAGAVGNAIDRIRYGAVIDFLDFHLSGWHFPTFNIADLLINIGVGLILIHLLFFSPKTAKN